MPIIVDGKELYVGRVLPWSFAARGWYMLNGVCVVPVPFWDENCFVANYHYTLQHRMTIDASAEIRSLAQEYVLYELGVTAALRRCRKALKVKQHNGVPVEKTLHKPEDFWFLPLAKAKKNQESCLGLLDPLLDYLEEQGDPNWPLLRGYCIKYQLTNVPSVVQCSE